jgi:hypothetical protein
LQSENRVFCFPADGKIDSAPLLRHFMGTHAALALPRREGDMIFRAVAPLFRSAGLPIFRTPQVRKTRSQLKKEIKLRVQQDGISEANQMQGKVNQLHFGLLSTGDTIAIYGMIVTLRR